MTGAETPALPHPLTPAGLARLTRARRASTLNPGMIYMVVFSALVLVSMTISALKSAGSALIDLVTALPAGVPWLLPAASAQTMGAEIVGAQAAGAQAVGAQAVGAQAVGAQAVGAHTAGGSGLALVAAAPGLQSVLVAIIGLAILSWLLTRFGPVGLPSAVLVWLAQHPGFSPAWFRSRILAVVLTGCLGGFIAGILALVPHLWWTPSTSAAGAGLHASVHLGVSASTAFACLLGAAAAGGICALVLIACQSRAATRRSRRTSSGRDRAGLLLWCAAGLTLTAACWSIPTVLPGLGFAPATRLVELTAGGAADLLSARSTAGLLPADASTVALLAAAVFAALSVAGVTWRVTQRPPALHWAGLEAGSRSSLSLRFGLLTIDGNVAATTVFSRLRARHGWRQRHRERIDSAGGLSRTRRVIARLPGRLALPAGVLLALSRTAGVPSLIIVAVALPWASALVPFGQLPIIALLIACGSVWAAGWLAAMSVRSSAANPHLFDDLPYAAPTCRLLLGLAPALITLLTAPVAALPAAVQLQQPLILCSAAVFALICAAAHTQAALRPPPNWMAPTLMTDAGAIPVGVLAELITPSLITASGGLVVILAAAQVMSTGACLLVLGLLGLWAVHRLRTSDG